ncbi:MAG TPA: hypothetical protein VID28_11455 [Methylomirabilota bacterium]|jgi:hypothetical protein
MKRSVYTVVASAITIGSMSAAFTVASAADLTNPGQTTTTEQSRMPTGSDFNNGPQGGGATLGSKDHIPTGGEFGNGPVGGAATDPTPRRMPSGAEFGNGPTGISQEQPQK